ncbi:hypothetical protein SAMN04515667_2150 [Formosa sp. Hel1_31_208]|nr:hypothetical protein SAMN04515667_2150 [Formosa sp. Hel1_31_208]
MIITITLVLSFLVALNFLLLLFSCNKTTKKLSTKKSTKIEAIKAPTPTKHLTTNHLAPTGS